MNQTQQKLMRTLLAAQVAVFEWGEPVGPNRERSSRNIEIALTALDECLKEATKLARELRAE